MLIQVIKSVHNFNYLPSCHLAYYHTLLIDSFSKLIITVIKNLRNYACILYDLHSHALASTQMVFFISTSTLIPLTFSLLRVGVMKFKIFCLYTVQRLHTKFGKIWPSISWKKLVIVHYDRRQAITKGHYIEFYNLRRAQIYERIPI